MAEPAISVSALGDGQFLVVDEHGRRVAYGVRVGATRWVFLDGQVFALSPTTDGTADAQGVADTTLRAPMPARVLTVSVSRGDAVRAGEVLVTLEAMKMELPIRAARDGVVASVSCQTGSMVSAGDTLVEIE